MLKKIKKFITGLFLRWFRKIRFEKKQATTGFNNHNHYQTGYMTCRFCWNDDTKLEEVWFCQHGNRIGKDGCQEGNQSRKFYVCHCCGAENPAQNK